MNRLTAWSCALLLLCGVLPAAAQPLRFSDDGTFRIVQFTDTHLCAGEWLPESEKTFARISRVIATERPDLVVFTGDVVTGRPAEGLWRRLLDTLQRCGAPFCIVLGNHDAEQDLSRQEIARLVTSAAGSLNGLNAGGELADAEMTPRRPRSIASTRTTIRPSRGSAATDGSPGSRSSGCGAAARPARRPAAENLSRRWPSSTSCFRRRAWSGTWAPAAVWGVAPRTNAPGR